MAPDVLVGNENPRFYTFFVEPKKRFWECKIGLLFILCNNIKNVLELIDYRKPKHCDIINCHVY